MAAVTPIDPLRFMRQQYQRAQYRGESLKVEPLDALVRKALTELRGGEAPSLIDVGRVNKSKGKSRQTAIYHAWRRLVGERFGNWTRTNLKAGTLWVECAHSIIIMELRPRLPALLAQLRPLGIKNVRLR